MVEESKCYNVTVSDRTATADALGFLGLGFAATFLGLFGMGMFNDAIMVVSTAVFLGGFAQLIAGIENWKKGSTFGATAFTAFALWWFSWAFIQLIDNLGLYQGGTELAYSYFSYDATNMGAMYYLLFWGIIATLLTIATFKIGLKVLTLVFILLDLTFFTTAFGLSISGIVALLLGIASLYLGIAIVMNDPSIDIKMPI